MQTNQNLTSNTVVHFKWIKSDSSEYQQILEQILLHPNKSIGGKKLMLELNFLMRNMRKLDKCTIFGPGASKENTVCC